MKSLRRSVLVAWARCIAPAIRGLAADVADNSRLWGEQYNRKLADALAVQNDIAHQIVEKLRLRLSNTQAAHMTTRQPRIQRRINSI